MGLGTDDIFAQQTANLDQTGLASVNPSLLTNDLARGSYVLPSIVDPLLTSAPGTQPVRQSATQPGNAPGLWSQFLAWIDRTFKLNLSRGA
jgi:hypothetical protein